MEREERRLRGLVKVLLGQDASERERAAGEIADLNGWKIPEGQDADVWTQARLIREALDVESERNRQMLLGGLASWFYVAERDDVLGGTLDAYRSGLGERWSAEVDRIAASRHVRGCGTPVLEGSALADAAAGAAGAAG